MTTNAHRIFLAAAALIAAGLAACSSSDGPNNTCTVRTDCALGQTCRQGLCVALPCGGRCANDEVCVSEECLVADGLDCASDPAICPTGFRCTAFEQCARNCAEDAECTAEGYRSCNVEAGFCGECTFNSECKDPVRKACDPKTARCVGCTRSEDCNGPTGPEGKYCDLETLTCKTGCRGDSECGPGQRCEGGTATRVGKCVECSPATELSDCIKAPNTRCDPRKLVCVQCLSTGDCGSLECDPVKQACVQCYTSAPCDQGKVCDQDANLCIPGCDGEDGRCPSDKPACDASRGSRGTCVACLVDAHCPRTTICDLSGAEPKCVPGCSNSSGQTDESRCIDVTGASPRPTDVRCDGNRGTRGQCVECRQSEPNDCPGKTCDPTTAKCRCKTFGEPCTANAQCGYVDPSGSGNCIAYGTSSGRSCMDRIQVNGVAQALTTPVCSAPMVNNACPSGRSVKAYYVGQTSGAPRDVCLP